MNKGGHRSWTFHGIGKPDVERELRAFSSCPYEQTKRNRGQDSAGPRWIRSQFRSDFAERKSAEVGQQQEQADEEAKVSDAVNDECFFAGVGGGGLLEPEANK